MSDPSGRFNQIADDLADSGLAIADAFLSPGEVYTILNGDDFKNHKLHFKKAGIGKVARQINEAVRGDFIQWIDPEKISLPERSYLDRLHELIKFLNQNLFLSLKGVELHRTVYPVGTHYERHLDQFKSDDHRKLSIICYLNENWKAKLGGQLRVYMPSGSLDILPECGRLVCFRSDKIEHEVLPATRERYSLTGWAADRTLQ